MVRREPQIACSDRRLAAAPGRTHTRQPMDAPRPLTFRANNELALHVPDPTAAAWFYVDVLGCQEVSRTPDCIALESGALRLYLLRDPARTHDVAVPSFDVPDRAAALASLQASGCRLIPIGPHAPGDVYVQDPFGVVFDVIERTGNA